MSIPGGRAMALHVLGVVPLTVAALIALPICAKAAEAAAKDPNSKTASDALAIEVGGAVMSDYIYRGVSLSARRPSAASYFDIDWQGFYVGANIQSVKLPTNPAAEITLSSGFRHNVAGYDLDLGVNYFYYPGEVPTGTTTKTNYWELFLGGEREFKRVSFFDKITFNGLTAYSPDVSATGAWGAYAEGQVTIDLPQMGLPQDLSFQLQVAAGYWRFGKTSPAQGGFEMPSYGNWHASLLFWYKENVSFELGYYDTSLSKEDCFVLTGDPMATPGGATNPISNPEGLRSRLCSATLLGRFSFYLEPLKSLK